MDDWEKFNNFCRHLDMEGITDEDWTHAKRVGKYFETKNLSEYDDFHVQSDTLLVADVFNSFWNMS